MEIQSMDEFVEQILNEKGITDVSPEVRKQLKEEMVTRLTDQINRAAIMQLSEEKAEELEKMMDDPGFTNEQLVEFMKNSGVDLLQVTLETMLKFRGLYLGTE